MQARAILALVLVIFIGVTAALSFVAGYRYRDARADVATVATEVAQQTARADNAEQARANNHASAQHAAKVEEKVAADAARDEAVSQAIEEEVKSYAIEHSTGGADDGACVRGDADDDFMRIWRAANAGQAPGPRPEHPAGADGGSRAGVAAADGVE